jgi:hypothetical protein
MSHWPQFTYLALVAVSFGMSIAEHGRPRAPADAWASLFSVVVINALLWAGGFFEGMF